MATRSKPFLLRSWVFSIASLILAAAFAIIAHWLYGVADKTAEFLPKVAEYALQISVIALLGAAVKEVVDLRNIARTRREKEDGLRGEFLRRLRAVHAGVTRSCYLMRVHNSARTWSEQSRSLIDRVQELQDIAEDLKTVPKLFDKQDEIVTGISEMSLYFTDCKKEYETRHTDVDVGGQKNMSLETIMSVHPMPWASDFFHSTGSFQSQYTKAFQKSESAMHEAVFGWVASNKALQQTGPP